ncbi:ATP-binding protein [Bradyrhizobium sp. SZCCHNR1093]|uniref:sensor histidine kinase n=1 Tax=Bradyrhizobium sp. SZCCHNR1093 TaxID=3057368 RepID=UPI0028ECE3A7|nr:ATP-binding protein [Bradyrhizobium sp. SZCCHNR1093]
MMPPRSLQWRISLWLGLGIALLWIVAAVATAQRLRHEMNRVFDSALEETAQRLLPLAVLDILDREDGDTSQRIATLREHDEYFTYIVRDARGSVLLRSHRADDAIFPPFAKTGFVDTPTHRLYFDAALRNTVTIAVAEPLAHRREVANKALLGLALPLGLLVPLGLVAVWGVVRVSTAPVRRLGRGIEARGSGDLSPIPVADLPSEIAPIADAVNHLLEGLRRALEAERSFTANSAHELRTPIAAALAQTQRLIAETQDAAAQSRAQQIETALRRLWRLSEKLMQLAKAEGGRLQAKETIDIASVLKLVSDEIMRDPATAGRLVLNIPATPVLLDIDTDAFAILARNLIENGLKHGASDAPVTVTLSNIGVLTVTNEGPPVPPELLTRLSRPFERGRTDAEGSGLGLAIARAIASGVGGELILTSPLPGAQSGFQARFSLQALGPVEESASKKGKNPGAVGSTHCM